MVACLAVTNDEGGVQCMLREPNGQLVSVAEREERFGLGEVKDELMMALGLNTEAPGSALAFLRRGYKASCCYCCSGHVSKYAILPLHGNEGNHSSMCMPQLQKTEAHEGMA